MTRAVEDRGYSQRRACGLVGMEPRVYRYRPARPDGGCASFGGAPAQLTLAIGDSYAGIAAAMAIGFALLHRERTGEGQYIESTLIDAYFNMQEDVPRVSLQGDACVPGRTGSLHPEGGPYIRVNFAVSMMSAAGPLCP